MTFNSIKRPQYHCTYIRHFPIAKENKLKLELVYLLKGKYCVYPRMVYSLAIVMPPPPPFWMTENEFRSHFSPFQINTQLRFFFTKWLPAAILGDRSHFSPFQINTHFFILFTKWHARTQYNSFATAAQLSMTNWTNNVCNVKYLYETNFSGHKIIITVQMVLCYIWPFLWHKNQHIITSYSWLNLTGCNIVIKNILQSKSQLWLTPY